MTMKHDACRADNGVVATKIRREREARSSGLGRSLLHLGVVMDRDPNGSSQFGRALTYL
jgi:hypothetical protein